MAVMQALNLAIFTYSLIKVQINAVVLAAALYQGHLTLSGATAEHSFAKQFFGGTTLWRNEDKSRLIFCHFHSPLSKRTSLAERPLAERLSLGGTNISWRNI
jgi:hypothetical protein